MIVAHGLTSSGSDHKQLQPMIEAMEEGTGALSADAGYCSEDNLAILRSRGIRGYVATGRLKQGGRRSRYRLRKVTIEPVFGQIKHARGFRQFLLHGLDQVRHEWTLVCIAHNLNKLAAHRASAQAWESLVLLPPATNMTAWKLEMASLGFTQDPRLSNVISPPVLSVAWQSIRRSP